MPPAAAPPAAPPVPGCAHCGWKEQHRQECTWCDRRICEWHGERIASGSALPGVRGNEGHRYRGLLRSVAVAAVITSTTSLSLRQRFCSGGALMLHDMTGHGTRSV